VTLQEQIRANRWRTLWLLILFALLVGGIGAVVGFAYDLSLLIVVAIVGFVYALFSWLSAGRLVAAVTGAKAADRAAYPRLYHVVETVAIAAGLPQPPPIYVIDDEAPNAFAAGRSPKTAYVAVTTGLLNKMSERELEGVIAHEISHVRNRDVRLMTMVAVLVGVIALVSDLLLRVTLWGGGKRGGGTAGVIALAVGMVALAIAPIAAVLIQLAVSRRREYLADASAAEITGDGEGLALALRTLLLDPTETKHATRAVAHLYIESPLNQASGVQSSMRSLFDTHPPLEARIAALEESGGFHLPPVGSTA
jgi:heat shock protein HtpX